MFRLEFKAKIITASRNKKDNYYMVGLADDKFDYYYCPLKFSPLYTN